MKLRLTQVDTNGEIDFVTYNNRQCTLSARPNSTEIDLNPARLCIAIDLQTAQFKAL